MISTANSVKAALRSRLLNEAALSGVQISHGHPYPDRPEREVVMIDRAAAGSNLGDRFPAGQRPRALNTTSREERYTLDVIVSVNGSARDRYPDLEERAYAIATAVDDSIRTWRDTTPSAYDGAARWVVVTAIEDREGLAIPGRDTDAADGGREAVVRIELSVAAGI